jgi:hypothetical protein
MARRQEQQMGFGTVQPTALPQYLRELKDRGILSSEELFLDIGPSLLHLPLLSPHPPSLSPLGQVRGKAIFLMM